MKLFAALLFSVLMFPLAAQAKDCDDKSAESPVAFEVQAIDSMDVAFDNALPVRQLGRLNKRVSFGGKLLGLTEVAFGARAVSTKTECGQPLVVLELHIIKQTVHVSSDVDKNSCTYRETVTHEQEHVAINRAVLASVQKDFAPKIDASRYSNAQDLMAHVQNDLVPQVLRQFQESAHLHEDFDAADKQATRSTECRQELAAYASSY